MIETPPNVDQRYRALAVGLIVLAGVIGYANTFDGEFVWDDVSSVLLHQHVQNPSKILELFREDQHCFGSGQGNFYRPLVSVSFMADFALSNDPVQDAPTEARPFPQTPTLLFHVTNLAWHLAAALALFMLLGRAGASPAVRFVAALLFTVHPLQSEAVAYISGRADMLAACFIFCALIASLGRPAAPGPIRAGLLGALAFAAALLSKESAMIYPFLLALFLVLRPVPAENAAVGRFGPQALFPGIAAAALLAVYVVLRSTMLSFAEKVESTAAPFGQRIVETGQALALYARLLFVPGNLHMERTLDGVPDWLAILGYVFLIAILAAAVLAYRAGHWRITAGFGWFVITWLPISGLFPLNAPMAEHWLYVPMAGFWWGCAEAIETFSGITWVRRVAVAAATVMVLAFLGVTTARNRDWHSNESIYRATLEQNPKTYRIHANLAETYKNLDGNLSGARRHYAETLDHFDTMRRIDKNAIFMNEAYSRLAQAGLLLGESRVRDGYRQQAMLRDAMDGFASVTPELIPREDDARALLIVAAMGKAMVSAQLGAYDPALSFFREAAAAAGDQAKAQAEGDRVASETKDARSGKLAGALVLFQTGKHVAQATFLAALHTDPPLTRLISAFDLEALVWPRSAEGFWVSTLQAGAARK